MSDHNPALGKLSLKDMYAFAFRLLTPFFGALCLYFLNSMTGDIKEIKTSMTALQVSTATDISDLKARMTAVERITGKP
jgi:hypothetical protein